MPHQEKQRGIASLARVTLTMGREEPVGMSSEIDSTCSGASWRSMLHRTVLGRPPTRMQYDGRREAFDVETFPVAGEDFSALTIEPISLWDVETSLLSVWYRNE